MEIIPEGKNFRLLHDDELKDILDELEKYLPEALKVSSLAVPHLFIPLVTPAGFANRKREGVVALSLRWPPSH